MDVGSGSIATLYASREKAVLFAGFDEARSSVIVAYWEGDPAPETARTVIRFTSDGTEVERGELTGSPWLRGPVCHDPRWTQEPADAPEGVEVDGRFFAGIWCGPISPDGRWMTYQVFTGPADSWPPPMDQWAIDLETEERVLLREGLLHCGGCDGRFQGKWSPSGRYVYFADFVSEGQIYLSDVQTWTTRVLFAESAGGDFEPAWSPVADVIVYPGPDGTSVLEDLTAGSRATLRDLPWPAGFDPTGRYLYSPGWTHRGSQPLGSTSVYELASGRVVASLPGQHVLVVRMVGAPTRALVTSPVVGVDGGFVAALEGASGCDGTAIYSGATLTTCVAGTWPHTSPDGTKVALIRRGGRAGAGSFSHPDGGGTASSTFYEIVVVDVATGAEILVTPEGLVDSTHLSWIQPPIWNAESTQLLVQGPVLDSP